MLGSMLVMWVAAVGTAAPVVLSDTVGELLATVEGGLTADTCAPALDAYFGGLEGMSGGDVAWSDIALNGDDVITQSYALQLALHKELQRLDAAGEMTDDCYRSMRLADLATRYLIDHVLEARPPSRRGDGWLVSPGFGWESLESGLRSGDVVVSRGTALSSSGIAHIGAIDSQFSHNLIIYVDESNGKVHTVEAYMEKGVIHQDIPKSLKHGIGRMVVMRYQDADVAARAAKFAYDRVIEGPMIGYDDAMDYENHDLMFCSEVPRWAFSSVEGGPQDVPARLTAFETGRNKGFYDSFGMAHDVYSAPSDVLFDPRFDQVAEWRDPDELAVMRRHDAVTESVYGWMENEGYALAPTPGDEAFIRLARALRSVPVLGLALRHSLSPKTTQKFLLTGMLLQNTGTMVLEELEERLAGRRDFVPYNDMRAEIEAIRIADLERWQADPETARFHRWIHP